MDRPTGVVIIAVLDFLGAALAVLLGIAAFLGMGFAAAMFAHSAGHALPAGFLAGLGAVLGIGFFIGAAIAAFLGWGIWSLKDLARIVQMVFAGIGALFAALGVMISILHFAIFGFFFAAIRLGINGLILWYLNQPHVKAAFQQRAAGATGAP